MALQLRPKTKPIPIPSFLHSFSSSSSNPDPNTTTANPGDTTTTSQSPPSSQPKSSFSSYFSDVKASLKLQHQQQHTPTPQSPRKPSFSFATSSPKPPSKMASLEEIRKNLSEFRRRSAAPSPTGPSSEPISFQELYKRNVIAKPEETSAETSGKGSLGSGKLSLDAIRESLRHLRSNNANVGRSGNDPISLSTFRKNLRLQPVVSNTGTGSTQVIGSGGLPASLFGKETEGKQEGDGSGSDAMKTEFIKMYSYEELGKKLKMLRPEKKVQGENWFSLEELNDRLMKLREVEEKETKSEMIAGVSFKDLRSSLLTLKMSNDEKTRKSTFQRLDILSHLGQTPNFMLGSPKEHLVEKYFHPDNMSSAEKLKVELQKVRDEFKMSESDCGSARVQVAQLTTKIKHLSSVLHKKDKHSRKGLLAMVQQRKKLLKYLRRSDWDSYCFVLSKLGLRDNPDYKN